MQHGRASSGCPAAHNALRLRQPYRTPNPRGTKRVARPLSNGYRLRARVWPYLGLAIRCVSPLQTVGGRLAPALCTKSFSP